MLLSRSLKSMALGIALIAGGCDRQSDDGAQPRDAAAAAGAQSDAGGGEALSGMLDRSQAGKEIPDVTLGDAAGNRLALRSLKGGPLLVNLWATWCAPCVVELPMLDRIARAMDGKLKVLTVSQDMTDTGKVAPFLTGRKLDRLEPWLDPKSDLTAALGAQTLPTTILFDEEGREIWRYVGGNDWTSEQSRKLLDEGTN